MKHVFRYSQCSYEEYSVQVGRLDRQNAQNGIVCIWICCYRIHEVSGPPGVHAETRGMIKLCWIHTSVQNF